MKKDELELAILDLWMTTRIPLTRANIQYHTGVARRKLQGSLDALVIEGTLEMDSDDAGETLYSVPGAQRPANGPRDFAERDRLGALTASLGSKRARKQAARTKVKAQSSALTRLRGQYDASTALSIATSAHGELAAPPGEGKKSLLASGGLSLAFGPLGWLYAGSLREAIPAGVAFAVLASILPTFLLLPILGVAMPLSGIAGLVYAWQYNQTGQRGRLFGQGEDDGE